MAIEGGCCRERQVGASRLLAREAQMMSAVLERREQSAQSDFDWYMELWVRHMRGQDDDRLCYPDKAAVCGKASSNYATGENDADLYYEMNDAKIGEVVDACVKSLESHERAAVHRKYGIARVFIFARMDYVESLNAGMSKLRILIARRL